MSIPQIKVQPLTQKAFSQYGTCIDLPAEGDYELRSSDRFDFYPKLCTYTCDSNVFQIGISTLYERPFRTVNMERHYHTQELMVPLTNPIIIVFSKNKGMDYSEEPDIETAEAFLITPQQGVVVDTGVWHWTPMPVGGDSRIICSFAENTSATDVDVRKFPAGEVLEVLMG